MATATKDEKKPKADERATIRVRAKRSTWYADQVMHVPGTKTEDFVLFPRRIGGEGNIEARDDAGEVLTAEAQFSSKTMIRLGPGKPRDPVELEKVYTAATSVLNGEDEAPEMAGPIGDSEVI